MANAGNKTNDSEQTEPTMEQMESESTSEMSKRREFEELKPDFWKPISRKVVGGSFCVTEAMNVSLGVVLRDIVKSSELGFSSMVFIPNARLNELPDKDTGEKHWVVNQGGPSLGRR